MDSDDINTPIPTIFTVARGVADVSNAFFWKVAWALSFIKRGENKYNLEGTID
jgi:hypothetical protein